VRREYRDPSNVFFARGAVLEDRGGIALAWTGFTRRGTEIALVDGSKYRARRVPNLRQSFTVTDQRTGEVVLESRWGKGTRNEPIRFRDLDLNYSLRRLEHNALPYWNPHPVNGEGTTVGRFSLRIASEQSAALTMTFVKNAKKNRFMRLPELGLALVGEDIHCSDTPLLASVGFILLWHPAHDP
jgi:hypothetical protein